MKLLVTAFSPFGGETINPALEVLSQLPKQLNGAEIIRLVLPTVFHQSAQMLEESLLTYRPNAILCLGQGGGRVGITPERVAINQDDARIPDNAGQQPIDQPIRPDGPAAYFSTLPIKAMVAALLNAGIPASVSNSAGTFVCNHLMYQALYLAERHLPTCRVGFVHLPYLLVQASQHPNTPSMSPATLVEGVRICLATLIAYEGKEDLKKGGGALV